ncbi:MAG TPA: prephenate dehydratase [Bacteroidales bacterium]|nr:prephenate dehydratase [Bacteroidales bacterium]
MMKTTANKVKKIAIQGGYGAFHEIAALNYFKDEEIEIVPSNTFKDLFKSLKLAKADYGIMAIENSLAGSILPNYNLLRESNMKIIGEIYLRIRQNLVALPGQTIEDIREVYSHPMAILQCQLFFDKYPHIRLVDSIDTALSAKDIQKHNRMGVGAIASSLAAVKYGLEIMSEGIETNKMNYTRFLILKDRNGDNQRDNRANKASIHFALAHKIGSLSKILSILSFYDINLTKIQSLPIIGQDWEYQFYLDIMWEDNKRYHQALEAIKPFTSDLGVLGEYEKGNTIMQ